MAESSLYVTNIVETKDKIELLPQKNKERVEDLLRVTVTNKENEDDKDILGFLRNQFMEFDSARPDSKWGLRYKQYIASIVYRGDGMANVNLALEQATVRNKIADMESAKSVVELIPTEEDDVNKVSFLKDIYDFVWSEANTDIELTKLKYSMLIFGTGIWFEGLIKKTYTQLFPEYNKDGTITGIPKTVTQSYLGGTLLDIRNVWVDPVRNFEDVNSCFIKEQDLTFEELEGMAKDPNFRSDAILEYISKNEGTTAATNTTVISKNNFLTKEEEQNGMTKKFNLLHYYNKSKNLYIVTDDTFQYIFRYGVNPYPHRELPITMIVDHPRPFELYGIGECELLENTKYERNVIRNQIIDYVRESNTLNFAVGDGVTFDDTEVVGSVMRIWNFRGNLGNTQFIKPPAQDSGLFNVDEILRNDATIITGIDVNSLVGNPSKTALEARLQEQTKLKSIYVTLRQLDYGLTRIMRQRLKNIETFLPYTTGKNIVGEKKSEKFRTVIFDNKKKEDVNVVGKDNQIETVGVKLTNSEGDYAVLELKPKLLQNNFDVRVMTPSTTPILKELNKYDLQELFNKVMQLAQIGLPEAIETVKKFKFMDFLKNSIKDIGFSPSDYIDDTQEVDKNALLQKMMSDIPAAPKFDRFNPEKNKDNSMIPQQMGNMSQNIPTMS